ncbi:hypothetical protein [Aeromicrobium sp. CTD01-1L150]|uniref:hypothetical protein n=1 Tax=Aeromicrobium sp. CTD01-1L150 TaxID=3341830 RepID=UPI0035C14075
MLATLALAHAIVTGFVGGWWLRHPVERYAKEGLFAAGSTILVLAIGSQYGALALFSAAFVGFWASYEPDEWRPRPAS